METYIDVQDWIKAQVREHLAYKLNLDERDRYDLARMVSGQIKHGHDLSYAPPQIWDEETPLTSPGESLRKTFEKALAEYWESYTLNIINAHLPHPERY